MSPERPAGDAEAALVVPADDWPLVRTREATLTRADLWRRASTVAQRLPDGPAALVLCERREHYLVALLALELRGRTCLMPPSRAPAVLDEVAATHPGSFRIDDASVAASIGTMRDGATTGAAPPDVATPDAAPQPRALDPGRVVAIGYTSGSTGRPRPNPKTWRSFIGPAACNAASLRATLDVTGAAQPWIVATVPSQHMYGMELTVALPLVAGVGLHASHPLFPADIASALATVPSPRVLVSTPVHLRALLDSDIELPAIAAIVSATAPLTAELAAALERRYATRVLEFFGSTETCVIASRRTALEAAWSPYPGLRITATADGSQVEAPWLDAPVTLQDLLEFDGQGRFRVAGRSADMIEVAGKRTSLGDLTRRLLGIPGVRDAVVVQPGEDAGRPVRRLVAFVVSEGPGPQAIATALAGMVDPVFMPRPIVCVEQLPRNDVGKLPREQLLRLVREHVADAATH